MTNALFSTDIRTDAEIIVPFEQILFVRLTRDKGVLWVGDQTTITVRGVQEVAQFRADYVDWLKTR